MSNKIDGNLFVTGHLTAGTMAIPAASVVNASVASGAEIARDKLALDNLKPYPILHTQWRVWDSLVALLPATSSSDDLGLYPGTWGTTPWLIRSADVKTTTVTLRAACEYALPAEYDDGETVTLTALAGMITTVADGSATIDFEVYEKGGTGAALGSDLCTTAATTINSLAFSTKSFTITPGGLAAGDVLQIRMTIAVVDTATATAVVAAIEQIKLLCDVRG